MSIETWKAEFYSTNPKKKMTKLEAIEHSLRKYEGLTQRNLDAHRVHVSTNYLFENTPSDAEFVFDIDTCALCKKYYTYRGVYESCGKCPLAALQGKTCLDEGSYFETFMEEGDSRPIRKALRKLLKEEQSRG